MNKVKKQIRWGIAGKSGNLYRDDTKRKVGRWVLKDWAKTAPFDAPYRAVKLELREVRD